MASPLFLVLGVEALDFIDPRPLRLFYFTVTPLCCPSPQDCCLFGGIFVYLLGSSRLLSVAFRVVDSHSVFACFFMFE